MTGQPQQATQAQKMLRLAMCSLIHMPQHPCKMGMVSRFTALKHRMSTSRGNAAVLLQQALNTRHVLILPSWIHQVTAFQENYSLCCTRA